MLRISRPGSYLFTGRAYDAETALYYYRARYYDYFTGRFLQPDPIRYADGLNLYSYVRDNPANWVDSLGLCSDVVSEAESAAINRAAAQAMEEYYDLPGVLEYGNYVFRNLETNEPYPMQEYTTGTISEVDMEEAWNTAKAEIASLPLGQYDVVAFCHRHGAPAGMTIEAVEDGIWRADPDNLSIAAMNYSVLNPANIVIDVYAVTPDGEVRFYNFNVHGPHSEPFEGTYVGNMGDLLNNQ